MASLIFEGGWKAKASGAKMRQTSRRWLASLDSQHQKGTSQGCACAGLSGWYHSIQWQVGTFLVF